MGTQTNWQTDTWADEQAHRLKDKWIDSQTDGQETQKDRQREGFFNWSNWQLLTSLKFKTENKTTKLCFILEMSKHKFILFLVFYKGIKIKAISKFRKLAHCFRIGCLIE